MVYMFCGGGEVVKRERWIKLKNIFRDDLWLSNGQERRAGRREPEKGVKI
jgi:hypothetical protein